MDQRVGLQHLFLEAGLPCQQNYIVFFFNVGICKFTSFTAIWREDVLGNVGTFPVLRFPPGHRGCLTWRQRKDTGQSSVKCWQRKYAGAELIRGGLEPQSCSMQWPLNVQLYNRKAVSSGIAAATVKANFLSWVNRQGFIFNLVKFNKYWHEQIKLGCCLWPSI